MSYTTCESYQSLWLRPVVTLIERIFLLFFPGKNKKQKNRPYVMTSMRRVRRALWTSHRNVVVVGARAPPETTTCWRRRPVCAHTSSVWVAAGGSVRAPRARRSPIRMSRGVPTVTVFPHASAAAALVRVRPTDACCRVPRRCGGGRMERGRERVRITRATGAV